MERWHQRAASIIDEGRSLTRMGGRSRDRTSLATLENPSLTPTFRSTVGRTRNVNGELIEVVRTGRRED